MKTKELTPNQIIAKYIKEFKQLNIDSGGMANKYDYKQEDILKNRLLSELKYTGFCEVLSKGAIIQLIALQRRLRMLPEHRFYMLFDFDK